VACYFVLRNAGKQILAATLLLFRPITGGVEFFRCAASVFSFYKLFPTSVHTPHVHAYFDIDSIDGYNKWQIYRNSSWLRCCLHNKVLVAMMLHTASSNSLCWEPSICSTHHLCDILLTLYIYIRHLTKKAFFAVLGNITIAPVGDICFGLQSISPIYTQIGWEVKQWNDYIKIDQFWCINIDT
jgi:hypothetical protein